MKISYDARGLAEPDAQAPKTATVTRGADGAAAVFDAGELTTRQINLELRRLVYDEGIGDVTILNPGAKHSIVVGILAGLTTATQWLSSKRMSSGGSSAIAVLHRDC